MEIPHADEYGLISVFERFPCPRKKKHTHTHTITHTHTFGACRNLKDKTMEKWIDIRNER